MKRKTKLALAFTAVAATGVVGLDTYLHFKNKELDEKLAELRVEKAMMEATDYCVDQVNGMSAMLLFETDKQAICDCIKDEAEERFKSYYPADKRADVALVNFSCSVK